MIHYICIIVREEIGDVLQCVRGDRGCTPHAYVFIYFNTLLMYLDSLCVCITLVGYALLYYKRSV